MRSDRRRWSLLEVVCACLAGFLVATGPTASAVSIDWVLAAGTGTPNACDPQSGLCFGSVADRYRIGKYEVTNAEYAEFPNAVADDDT